MEKGRGGMFSLPPKVDDDPRPRTAIGDKSGISSGTEGTGCSTVLVPAARCACACGKYDARGVEVGEEVASIGVFTSSVTFNRVSAHMRVLERGQAYRPMGECKDTRHCPDKHRPCSACRLPLQASQWA